ncbi:transcription factor E2F3-like [Fundulus diaphanus]
MPVVPISRSTWKTFAGFGLGFVVCSQTEEAFCSLTRLFTLAYVGCEDIRRLTDFQQQTVIVIRSPPETKLIIPPPAEDGIRMELNSENGPIVALTCDGGPLTSEPANSSRVFSALESRVRVSRMNKVESKKTAI